MNKKQILIIFVLLALISGCTRLGGDNSTTQQASVVQPQSSATAAPIKATDISPFINEEVASQLSEQELSEAASAQFYALQFGRVGAPRVWQGETGASGRVYVGPYVRVNALNCRQFTHIVTLKEEEYQRKGTACREIDGIWSVDDS